MSFAYDLERTDFIKLFTLYTALFFLFYKLIKFSKQDVRLLTWISFGFRAVFILAIPNMSQDFYRFIWDGRMLLEGFNPYLYTPESLLSIGRLPVAQAQELFEGMGQLNASHFTNYPPLSQLCYAIAGIFTSKSILGSVIVLRLVIIAADFGTLYFGKKLLAHLNKPKHLIFWYILNPFIIIELTGNLHFEGVMIFFLVWSLYLLHLGKWQWAAVIFGLSVSVKLIPLLFLPLFWQWFISKGSMTTSSTGSMTTSSKPSKPNGSVISNVGKKSHNWIPAYAGMTRLGIFYTIIGLVNLLLFAPFYSFQFLNNYAETVALWFNNFEFNASLYYIAREIGYLFRGFNEIAIIGKISAVLVFVFIVIIAFKRKNKSMQQLITAMMFALAFYYFTATTVHPWYIATLLGLSIFTKYKFPLVWSFVIVLSYLAYFNINGTGKAENLWIIAIEYAVVYGVFIYEICLQPYSKANTKWSL